MTAFACCLGVVLGPAVAFSDEVAQDDADAAMARLREDFERHRVSSKRATVVQGLALMVGGVGLATLGWNQSEDLREADRDYSFGRWDVAMWTGAATAILGLASVATVIVSNDESADDSWNDLP
jgi:hypothetical protein